MFVLSSLGFGAAASGATGDEAVTALGAQGLYDQGLGAADVDPLISERLRWTLADDGRTRALLLADGRFTLDAGAEHPWEQHRVRTLGVELASERWTVQLGRHAVSHGGPRLVDGLQVLHRPADGDLTVGAWAGLAPDLFTTLPRLRPGGGPIVAWERPELQASIVGEVLGVAEGLDRVGLLAQLRIAPSTAAEVSLRLDSQLTAAGVMGLADGAVFGRWRPSRSVRLDALYDAYTSVRYLQSTDLDPDLQRFAARLEALDAHFAPVELPDDSVFQLFGLGGSWQAAQALAPRFAVTTRYRYHPRVEDRYGRVVPQVGVVGLAQGRLDATVDVAWTWHGDSGSREDVGLCLVLDPLADGRVTFDGSIRGIVDPDFGGRPGWYTDLFVDVLAVDSTVVVAGASATKEPTVVPDVAVAGFVWLQHRLKRSSRELREAQLPAATTRLP